MGKTLRLTLMVAAVSAGLYLGLRAARWLAGDTEPDFLEVADFLRDT